MNNPSRNFINISHLQPLVDTPREPILKPGLLISIACQTEINYQMNIVVSMLFNLTNYIFFKIKCPLFYRSSKSTLIPCLYCSIAILNFLNLIINNNFFYILFVGHLFVCKTLSLVHMFFWILSFVHWLIFYFELVWRVLVWKSFGNGRWLLISFLKLYYKYWLDKLNLVYVRSTHRDLDLTK